MKKAQFKRRFITLIEMMIVMFLIAMITGVIAYNYTGSLEEGKAFKTEAAIGKIQTILDLHLAREPGATISGDGWKAIINSSNLVKDKDSLLKDGWGGDYVVTDDNGTIKITSAKLEAFRTNKPGAKK